MRRWVERLFVEKCPVCKRSLQVDHHKSTKLITVKVCPLGHYAKETYPFLEQTIEFYPSKKEKS